MYAHHHHHLHRQSAIMSKPKFEQYIVNPIIHNVFRIPEDAEIHRDDCDIGFATCMCISFAHLLKPVVGDYIVGYGDGGYHHVAYDVFQRVLKENNYTLITELKNHSWSDNTPTKAMVP